MKPYFRSLLIMLAALLLAACGTGSPGAGEATPVETPTPFPTPFETQIEPPAAVVMAQAALAEQLGVSTDEIIIREIEQVQWPDACLGAAQPAEMCAEVMVDGFRVVFEVDGQTYEYHTDMDGSQMRALASLGPKGEENMPNAVLAARLMLAQQLGLSPEEIQVVRFEKVDWPDSCLGVQKAGQMCAQVITPGYRVVFDAQGTQYEFHTDEEGGAVVVAMAPLPQINDTVLAWEETVDGNCRGLEIGPEGLSFGLCGSDMQPAELSPERAEQLQQLLASYQPFSATTPAGEIDFQGQGQQVAVEAEQRSVAEWARLVYQEAESGRTGAAWGLAVAWQREGGIAGFCDDLAVYMDGWALASSCKSGGTQGQRSIRLSAGQLEQLYAWVDQYQSFEYSQKDDAMADAMAVTLVFNGNGEEQAPPETQEEIVLFAQTVYTDAAR